MTSLISPRLKFGIVVIGRNEGERLRRCLAPLSAAAAVVVYVDSGSTDGSPEWAREEGVTVIDLETNVPFTAARARNAGFRWMRAMAPDLGYVQFVDGDCELVRGWFDHAVSLLDTHADIGAVCGRLRERHPEQSIYTWLCDQEWNRVVGESRSCGGIAMIRVKALEAVGGYREDLIAGEEPELCLRLRAAGWRIWRLHNEMAFHDAGMMHFGQWWTRALRGGYGFAQGAYLHGASPERHFVWEVGRAWFWGVWLPLACLVAGLLFGPWGWAACLIYPLQGLRQTMRNRGPLGDRALLALFQMLARFPEGFGQVKFLRDRLLGRQARLIEYK